MQIGHISRDEVAEGLFQCFFLDTVVYVLVQDYTSFPLPTIIVQILTIELAPLQVGARPLHNF